MLPPFSSVGVDECGDLDEGGDLVLVSPRYLVELGSVVGEWAPLEEGGGTSGMSVARVDRRRWVKVVRRRCDWTNAAAVGWRRG